MVALCCFASINLHGPGYVKAGQLRALAVTGLTRSDALPDLPPVAETLPGYEAASFHGIGAPCNSRPPLQFEAERRSPGAAARAGHGEQDALPLLFVDVGALQNAGGLLLE